MIKLYTSANCKQCGPVKVALNEAGIEFTELDSATEYGELKRDCERIGLDVKQIKSSPVMVADDGMLYDGLDCLTAIEFGEVE